MGKVATDRLTDEAPSSPLCMIQLFLASTRKSYKKNRRASAARPPAKPWRSARKPGETPHPLPESVAPFTRFFGSRAAMPASCSAQGALTELLFPPIHNLFPPSSACNFFICFLRNSIIFLSKRKQSYAPRALPLWGRWQPIG